jgi:hypothetical protein
MDPIEQLLAILNASPNRWPLTREADVRKQIGKWRAFQTGDREVLRELADWKKGDRRYHVDKLPATISEAFANLLFDTDPEIKASSDSDQPLLNAIIEENALASELHSAADQSVGEGEVWARVFVDEDLADVPLISWHSRLEILPLWVGAKLTAAAVITELRKTDRGGETLKTVWRHFEIHAPGQVFNALYKGRADRLGRRVDLGDHPETAALEEEWNHGLPTMLLFRIPNKARRWQRLAERRVGVSQYDGIEDELLTLNEAATIGAENMRLTAKKRIVVPETAVRSVAPNDAALVDNGDGSLVPAPQSATWDAGEDVIVSSPLDEEMGKSADAYKVLEYSFDAAALIAYRRDTESKAITRAGLTSVYLGTDEQSGAAPTGVALRTKLIPTASAAKGKGRFFTDTCPKILCAAAMVDALPAEQGGFGRGWTTAQDPPSFELADSLPRDPVEEATVHATSVTARIESIEQAVRATHPDWSDEQIDDEVKAIRSDQQNATPDFGQLPV